MTNIEINELIQRLTSEEQKRLFVELRKSHPIHSLEEEWNIPAEFILEAIARSQDITKRGVRGIIAELAFSRFVLDPIGTVWKEEPIVGDKPYDSMITNGQQKILIQTKNQRLERGVPKRPTQRAISDYPELEGWFVVETQKTRTGKKSISGGSTESDVVDTRPYRFGEFDILSVCMQPSSGDWKNFMFTPATTLLQSPKNSSLIATFQPVPGIRCYNWTDSLLECIEWVQSPETIPESIFIVDRA